MMSSGGDIDDTRPVPHGDDGGGDDIEEARPRPVASGPEWPVAADASADVPQSPVTAGASDAPQSPVTADASAGIPQWTVNAGAPPGVPEWPPARRWFL